MGLIVSVGSTGTPRARTEVTTNQPPVPANSPAANPMTTLSSDPASSDPASPNTVPPPDQTTNQIMVRQLRRPTVRSRRTWPNRPAIRRRILAGDGRIPLLVPTMAPPATPQVIVP